MAKARLLMRKVREVLRLKALGFSSGTIARSLGIAKSTVSGYLTRAERAGLTWETAAPMSDREVEARLFTKGPGGVSASRPVPDWREIHLQLKNKHVTLKLLWEEYKKEHPDGYQYSQFCERYRRWRKSLPAVWMRQEYRAGDKLFADFSGDGIAYFDPASGEWKEASLFVGVLGASSYFYAEATERETVADWVNALVHTFNFLGGVPALVVPDQPRSVAKRPCRYEPELQATLDDLARHFGTCILPARPRKPRDKAKAEAGVLLAQRWIIARLRHKQFTSLREINAAIRPLLTELNGRPIRKIGRSRRELFETVDKPALKPLPAQPFDFSTWRIGVRVNLDYHVGFDRNDYSVPYKYAGKRVDIRATQSTVEIFFEHRRIATHLRSYSENTHVTDKAHMPRSHREHAEWMPSRIVKWAESVGPSAKQLVEEM